MLVKTPIKQYYDSTPVLSTFFCVMLGLRNVDQNDVLDELQAVQCAPSPSSESTLNKVTKIYHYLNQADQGNRDWNAIRYAELLCFKRVILIPRLGSVFKLKSLY